jgi:hypothetical protein
MKLVPVPAQLNEFALRSTKYFGVDPRTKSARRRVVSARMMFVNFLIRNQGMTNALVCELLNLKHSLVMYYLDRHEVLIESDAVYRDTYISYKSFLFN